MTHRIIGGDNGISRIAFPKHISVVLELDRKVFQNISGTGKIYIRAAPETHFSDILIYLRDYIKLNETVAIYGYCNGNIILGTRMILELFELYRNSDKLEIKIFSENFFG